MNPIDDIFDELERFSFIKKYRKYIQPVVTFLVFAITAGYVVGVTNV